MADRIKNKVDRIISCIDERILKANKFKISNNRNIFKRKYSNITQGVEFIFSKNNFICNVHWTIEHSSYDKSGLMDFRKYIGEFVNNPRLSFDVTQETINFICDSISKIFIEYALPFLDDHNTIEKLIHEYEMDAKKGRYFGHGYIMHYNLAFAYYLIGKFHESKYHAIYFLQNTNKIYKDLNAYKDQESILKDLLLELETG